MIHFLKILIIKNLIKKIIHQATLWKNKIFFLTKNFLNSSAQNIIIQQPIGSRKNSKGIGLVLNNLLKKGTYKVMKRITMLNDCAKNSQIFLNGLQNGSDWKNDLLCVLVLKRLPNNCIKTKLANVTDWPMQTSSAISSLPIPLKPSCQTPKSKNKSVGKIPLCINMNKKNMHCEKNEITTPRKK